MKEKKNMRAIESQVRVLADSSRDTRNVRKAMLLNADAKFINLLGEIALNTLKGILPISRHYKKKLVNHSDIIRKIGSNLTKPNQRKKLITTNPDTVALMLKAVFTHLIPVIRTKSIL